MPLDGRTAVVTGGGRGIGAAIAGALARRGASIIVAARSADRIERVANDLIAAGHRAWAVTCDVTDADSVSALLERARAHAQHVDILVNSAGAADSTPFERLTRDEWDRLLAVNATGPFLCMQTFLPEMVERGWGRIVNVASVAGLTGARYIAAYTASKHAVIGLTRSVATEVAPRGVTVNAVCPGYVDTPMTDESLERIVAKTGRSREDALAAILDTTPQGRLIQPEEVAHAVVALCEDDARGINGQAIVIDGGGLLA